MKEKIYFPNSTNAADLMARRNAVRAVSGNPNLRFISTPRIVCKPIQDRCVIEPSPIAHKTIDEVI
jgi:hypothetical protein